MTYKHLSKKLNKRQNIWHNRYIKFWILQRLLWLTGYAACIVILCAIHAEETGGTEHLLYIGMIAAAALVIYMVCKLCDRCRSAKRYCTGKYKSVLNTKAIIDAIVQDKYEKIGVSEF